MTATELFDWVLRITRDEQLRGFLKQREVLDGKLHLLSSEELRTVYRYEISSVSALRDHDAWQADLRSLRIESKSYSFDEFIAKLRQHKSDVALLAQRKQELERLTPQKLNLLRRITTGAMLIGGLMWLGGCAVNTHTGGVTMLFGVALFLAALYARVWGNRLKPKEVKTVEQSVYRLNKKLVRQREELPEQIRVKREKIVAALNQVERERLSVTEELERLSPAAYGCTTTLELKEMIEARHEYVKQLLGDTPLPNCCWNADGLKQSAP